MLRNSDATANAQSGGVHDYSLRAIVGCQQLNCNASQSDPNYNNANYNAQYIAPNQSTYDKGQAQLKTGVTYDQLVTKNVKNNPVSTGIAGVGLVGLGVATGGATTVGTRVLAGSIGSGFNAIYQSTQNQPIDWLDVGIAGVTGFVAGGGSLAQGLTSSLGVNTGGALVGSTIKGENPNGAVGGAAAGTVVGYGLGKGVESVVKIKTAPWYKPDWVDTGVVGVQKWNPPSAAPTVSGNSVSSAVQETFGDPIKNYINKKQGN
jgi:filamentous hemagglutinin